MKKKTRTTYGVYNLIEWHALLQMGKATVKVPFTGGSMTTQGVTPATFTTENPVVQFAIERSPEFKTGKIKVVRRTALEGTIEIGRNLPKAAVSGEEAAKEAAGDGDVSATGNDEEVNPMPEEDTDIGSTAARTQVEFSCNDDAKDYLEQTFGFVRSKLRNREDIVKAGMTHNVDITFV